MNSSSASTFSTSPTSCTTIDRGLLQCRLLELHQAVVGVVPGRNRQDQIIFAKLMETEVADVAAANVAYDRA